MKAPDAFADWLTLDEVGSTQEAGSELVRRGKTELNVVFAHDQLAGKGRFGRTWESVRGDSLTMSLILWERADWPRPWLIGMAVAIAVAETIDCRLRWPNDLAYHGKKTGGILTELFTDTRGRKVPVVGIGLNLLQMSFPESLAHATSVLLATGKTCQARDIAEQIVGNLSNMPDPTKWEDIESAWMARDSTPGKEYRLADGREAVALHVGHDGVLVCESNGERIEVVAAEALFARSG